MHNPTNPRSSISEVVPEDVMLEGDIENILHAEVEGTEIYIAEMHTFQTIFLACTDDDHERMNSPHLQLLI
jgi:hypothetical protein